MKESKIELHLKVFENETQLPAEIAGLMGRAVEAREKAYAPYSSFFVGAAVLLESGEIVTGSNQENAAFPSGLCAERVAIFSCGANFPGQQIKALAISARSLNHILEDPIGPCGACRQSLLEYEQKQKLPIPVYFRGEKGKIVMTQSISDLLPLAFGSQYL